MRPWKSKELIFVGLLTGIMSGLAAYGVFLLPPPSIPEPIAKIIAIILGFAGGSGTYVSLVVLPEH